MSLPLLRPRTAGEILDAAFQFMRAEYGALLMGTSAFLLPPMVLAVILPGLAPLWRFIGNVLYIAATVVPVAIVTEVYLGRPVDVMAALRTVMRRFGSIWLAALISGILIAVGTLLLVIPGVIAFARTFAMPAVVLAEGETGSASLQRSRDLTRGFTWHILATLGVAYVIFFLAYIGLGIGVGALSGMLALGDAGITFLVEALVIFLYPFVGVVSAMLYMDLRVRKEALDVQMMAEALGEPLEPAGAA